MSRFKVLSKVTAFVSKAIIGGGSSQSDSDVDPSAFQLNKVGNCGLKCGVSVVAYDPCLSLLAAGTYDSNILICGKFGIEYRIQLPRPKTDQSDGPTSVKFLHFLVSEGVIAAIDSANTIFIYDISKIASPQAVPELIFEHKFVEGAPSFSELPTGSPWLYVGFQNGKISIVN
ncbi:hypothetical protein BKA69DRAFT_761831 [Paraphysoderma sedebokerense]|nr:hypothetical protein BKA69DRAFT_761831 [Paraphysoderma sedebokerense]